MRRARRFSKNVHRNPKMAILRRPQFIGKNIPRKPYLKRIPHTSPPTEVDATLDVLVALINPIPIGLMTGMGVGSAMVRAINQMAVSGGETIKERAEETRAAERRAHGRS